MEFQVTKDIGIEILEVERPFEKSLNYPLDPCLVSLLDYGLEFIAIVYLFHDLFPKIKDIVYKIINFDTNVSD